MPDKEPEKGYPIPSTPLLPQSADDFQDWVRSSKHFLLEPHHKRPIQPFEFCDIQKFAYNLCARNLTSNYARDKCKFELEDLYECERGNKRRKRMRTLHKASQKVGDRVPELTSTEHRWQY